MRSRISGSTMLEIRDRASENGDFGEERGYVEADHEVLFIKVEIVGFMNKVGNL
jgi:hypothetical protein